MQEAFRVLGCPVMQIVLGARSEVPVPENLSVYYTGRARTHPLLWLCRTLQLHKLFPRWFDFKSDEVIRGRVAKILRQQGWRERPDLVIKDFTNYAPACFDGDKVVSVMHQLLSNIWEDPQIRSRARRSYILAAVSHAVAEDARGLGLSVEHILYNPLNIALVRDKSTAFEVKGDYILYVGRLHPAKGVYDLLEAYAKTQVSQQLWYVGSGRELEKLQQRAQQLGIAERVRFLDFQNNPYPYIAAASLLVMPSHAEAMSYVCLEAAVLDTPFLVSDYAAAKEFFEPRVTVALQPQEQYVDRLAECMVHALAAPSPPGVKPGVLETLDPQRVVQSYLDLI
jgi:glycosyltransferase involved in cell wall biosynthesis